MFYPGSAVERAMRIQEVVMRAVTGQIQWHQAAEILGVSCRTIRRWKAHYEGSGYDAFIDRRRQHPSPRRAPVAMIQEVVRLYQQRYADLHVKHFHEKLVEEHGITQSYTWVKTVLQNAGLVERRSRRSKHRRRRPRRPLPGMLLHLDASRHCWMPLCPDQKDDLLVLMDDATSRSTRRCWCRRRTPGACCASCATASGHTGCSARSTPTGRVTSCTPRCRANHR